VTTQSDHAFRGTGVPPVGHAYSRPSRQRIREAAQSPKLIDRPGRFLRLRREFASLRERLEHKPHGRDARATKSSTRCAICARPRSADGKDRCAHHPPTSPRSPVRQVGTSQNCRILPTPAAEPAAAFAANRSPGRRLGRFRRTRVRRGEGTGAGACFAGPDRPMLPLSPFNLELRRCPA
jgi:hypothetical protein